MNPKHIAFLSLLFLLPAIPSKAEELTHVMACRVKDYVGLQASDGIVTRFSEPSEQWAQIGQTLLLTIYSGSPVSSSLLPIGLTFGGYDEKHRFLSSYSQLEDSGSIFIDPDSIGIRSVDPSGRMNVDTFSVSKNRVSAKSLVGNQILSLKRYYRSDWNGIYSMHAFTDGDGYFTESWALDCKTTSDRLDEIFERVSAEIDEEESSSNKVTNEEPKTRDPKHTFLIADLLKESNENSYPELPFTSSVEYLSAEFTRDQRKQYFENMTEVALRCGGLFYLLGGQQSEDGISQDSLELQLADVLLAFGGLYSFQSAYGEDYANKSREEFDSFISNRVAPAMGEYGEIYAQWINAHGITAEDISNDDHPFAQEFNYCHDFGSKVLEGSKLMQSN